MSAPSAPEPAGGLAGQRSAAERTPHRALPIVEAPRQGGRLRPRLYDGKLLRQRRWVAHGLITMFVLLPLLRVSGRPALLFDVVRREFTFFGSTYFATDGFLLMLLLLTIFVGIVWITALVGRAWCGWGCPQTVYLEFVFRPIERLFEGGRTGQLRLDRKGGGVRRLAKNLVFALLAFFVANVFLAYFVGVDVLVRWVSRSPAEHPVGFSVMAVTASLVFFDFAYFREQMCTVACPYARLQSVLLDRDSLVIRYDAARGEPRHKGKLLPGNGDCIDCGACVQACPTGIDIRHGLQLECIACGQCVDACNTIMPKIGRPLGLIGYASEGAASGEASARSTSAKAWKSALVRPRMMIYSVVLVILSGALVGFSSGRTDVDVTILRGIGAPFTLTDGDVAGQVRVKIENRSREAGKYSIDVRFRQGERLLAAEEVGARVIIPENPLSVAAESRSTESIFVIAPLDAFSVGQLPIVVVVTTPGGRAMPSEYRLLGPVPKSTARPSAAGASPSAASPEMQRP